MTHYAPHPLREQVSFGGIRLLPRCETAKYLVATDQSTAAGAALINRHADRFLFGSDSLSPAVEEKYLKCYRDYAPLWKALNDDARHKVLKGNYERLFDAAKAKARAREAAHPATY